MSIHLGEFLVDFNAVSIAVLLLYLAAIITSFVAMIRVIQRAGYSGWWVLLALVPIVNMLAFWYFAFAPWPAVDRKASPSG